MSVKFSSKTIEKLKNRPIFVDANVLIYLFWPTGSVYWENAYAATFKKLLHQGNQLFVSFLVLSEFVNTVTRIEKERLKNKDSYKKFRSSSKGQTFLKSVYTVVKAEILDIFKMTGKIFDKQSVEDCLIVDELDFNDKGIFQLCREKSFVLWTNDKDFKNTDLDVLTENRSYY